jgi:hypothetical protein
MPLGDLLYESNVEGLSRPGMSSVAMLGRGRFAHRGDA